jgi:uncharacterized protein YfaS (alpha-2-macroglobulin family)
MHIRPYLKHVLLPVVLLVLTAYTLWTPSAKRQVDEIASKFETFSESFPEDRVYLQFDKALYQPGEVVWFNAYVRNATDFGPSEKSEILHVEFINPKGGVVKKLQLITTDGVVKGDFHFSRSMAGGIYKVKAYTNWQKNDRSALLFEKTIQLQQTVLPDLLMKLDFKEKGFSAGDEAYADFELRSTDDAILTNHPFQYKAQLQGKTFISEKGTTDKNGKATVRFKLPNQLTSNDGLLTITASHDGKTESVSRAIPITLNTVVMEFYPEGGDLVAGLQSRVAFVALDENGEPARVAGTITDNRGRKLAEFRSYHHGMGAFYFTPEKGKTYTAKLNTPKGIARKFELPEAINNGLVVNVNPQVNEKLGIELHASKKQNLSLIVQVRGKIYHSASIEAKAGRNTHLIPLKGMPIGVAQITIFDESNVPVIERMAFVNKHQQMQVEITSNKEEYLPREKVEMTIQAKDFMGNPISGDLSMAVVDDKLLTMNNDKSGHILSKMLLEADLKGEIDEPNFYFDPKEPKADQALDYLMMTRGWRRFSWNKVLKNDVPRLVYQPEHATIAGTVTNFKPDAPAEKHKVTIKGTDFSTTTDKDGKFTFKGVDLSSPKTLLVHKGKKKIEYTVNKYNTNLNLEYNGGTSKNIVYSYASSDGQSRIKGKVLDKTTGEPVPFCNVLLMRNNETLGGAATDFDGRFSIHVPQAGEYDLQTRYIGYQPTIIRKVVARADRITFVDIQLRESAVTLNTVEITSSRASREVFGSTANTKTRNKGKRTKTKEAEQAAPAFTNDVDLAGFEVVEYRAPLIEKDAGASGATITREDIRKMPGRSVQSIATTVGGVYSEEGSDNLYIRGARSEATHYYVDGVKVRGSTSIPKAAIAEVTVITGGIPANIGDVTGGVIQITTKSPHHYYYSSNSTAPKNYTTRYNQHAKTIYQRGREFPKVIHKTRKRNEQMIDDRNTIFWAGNLKLDKTGKATVSFFNNDEVTTFRATAEGISSDGLLGRGVHTYAVKPLLSIEGKIPSTIMAGDQLQLPLVVSNNTDEAVEAALNFHLPEGWKATTPLPETVNVRANHFATIILELETGNALGIDQFLAEVNGGGMQEKLVKEVLMEPQGFPVITAFNGNKPQKEYTVDVFSPVNGSIQAELNSYPSTMSTLLGGMQSMLREPHGCFEQVSSSTYPNLLVLNLLKESGKADAGLEKRALGYINNGYKKLAAYETSEHGFDLWGKAPANIPLTAFGLMEFTDMQKVYDGVDADMMKRTKKFLMGKRDGQGGFKGGKKTGHGYGGPGGAISNAYIVWALVEAGVTEITPEINKAYEVAKASNDPYLKGLTANSLIKSGNQQKANELLQQLTKRQNEDGSWMGETYSVMRSTHKNLRIETTSLVIMAMLHDQDKYGVQTQQAIDYLLKSRSGYGGFGTTQATVLALKAITAYKGGHQPSDDAGELIVYVNNKEAMRAPYDSKSLKGLKLEGLGKYLKAGKNKIKVKYTNVKKPAPYTVRVNWNTTLPQTDEKVSIAISAKLDKEKVKLGETARLAVELKNTTNNNLSSPLAVVGIPAGFSVQPWQLRELQEKQAFDFYEIVNNTIVFYYSYMQPREIKNIALDLKSEIPGTYESAAASAYLYYSNEFKFWTKGNIVEIVGG